MLAWFGVGNEGRSPPKSALSAICLEYQYAELQQATDNFDVSMQLGCGSYGAVFRGQLGDGTEVAIKLIDLGKLDFNAGPTEDAGFDDEVRVLSKFRHPNLVTLMGWSRRNDLRLLVYELLPGGDVQRRLRSVKEEGHPFSWRERLSVLVDAACGLSHMHNATPKAFHRDIKTPNILLDKNGTAKMADFGLSCVTPQGNATKQHMTVKNISGTPGYADPYYISSGKVTEANEVYSFGVVMLEMLMNLPPAQIDDHGGIMYPIFNKIQPSIAGCEHRVASNLDESAEFPFLVAQELVKLALSCITNRMHERPQFAQLVRKFRQLQAGAVVPAPPPVDQSFIPPSWARQRIPVEVRPQISRVASPMKNESVRNPCVQKVTEQPRPEDLVTIECVFAAGVDLRMVSDDNRVFTLASGFTIGRQHQPDTFEVLVPDQQNLCVISRNHLTLVRTDGWAMKNLSINPIKVNDVVVMQKDPPVVISNLSRIAFLPRTHAQDLSAPPFLEFQVRFSVAESSRQARHDHSPKKPAKVHAPLFPLYEDQPRAALPYFVCIDVLGARVGNRFLPIAAAKFGRQHQTSYFESILPDNDLLCCISRTHFEILQDRGRWSVRNVSSNPLYVDGRLIARGEARPLVHGTTVAFLSPPDRGSQEPLLTLQAKLVECPLPPCNPKILMLANPDNVQDSALTQSLKQESLRDSPLAMPAKRESTHDNSPAMPSKQERALDNSLAMSAKQESPHGNSPAMPFTRDIPQGNSLATPAKQESARDNALAMPVARESARENSLTTSIKRESAQDNSPAIPVLRESAQGNSLAMPVMQEGASDNSPAMPLTQESAQDNSPAIPVKRESVRENSLALPAKRESVRDSSAVPTFSLEVVHAINLEMDTLDKHERVISSNVDAVRFQVGMLGFSAWFEKLFRLAPSFIVFINRELVDFAYDTAKHTVAITNLSPHAVYLDQHLLEQNVPHCAEHGSCISMATAGFEGPIHFLKLKLWVQQLPVGSEPSVSDPPVNPTSTPIPDVRTPTTNPDVRTPTTNPDIECAPALNAPVGLDPGTWQEARFNPPMVTPFKEVRLSVVLPPMEMRFSALESKDIPTLLPGQVCLELCGQAVNMQTVENRRIYWNTYQPLLVGRRTQLSLFRSCLAERFQSFVSRDHFELEMKGCDYYLTALATNPMYLRKAYGNDLVSLATRLPVGIRSGDEIVLYTGEEPIGEMLFFHLTIADAPEDILSDTLVSPLVAHPSIPSSPAHQPAPGQPRRTSEQSHAAAANDPLPCQPTFEPSLDS